MTSVATFVINPGLSTRSLAGVVGYGIAPRSASSSA